MASSGGAEYVNSRKKSLSDTSSSLFTIPPMSTPSSDTEDVIERLVKDKVSSKSFGKSPATETPISNSSLMKNLDHRFATFEKRLHWKVDDALSQMRDEFAEELTELNQRQIIKLRKVADDITTAVDANSEALEKLDDRILRFRKDILNKTHSSGPAHQTSGPLHSPHMWESTPLGKGYKQPTSESVSDSSGSGPHLSTQSGDPQIEPSKTVAPFNAIPGNTEIAGQLPKTDTDTNTDLQDEAATLLVLGISSNATFENVSSVFSSCGTVLNCSIFPIFSSSGKQNSVALIEFACVDHAVKAKKQIEAGKFRSRFGFLRAKFSDIAKGNTGALPRPSPQRSSRLGEVFDNTWMSANDMKALNSLLMEELQSLSTHRHPSSSSILDNKSPPAKTTFDSDANNARIQLQKSVLDELENSVQERLQKARLEQQQQSFQGTLQHSAGDNSTSDPNNLPAKPTVDSSGPMSRYKHWLDKDLHLSTSSGGITNTKNLPANSVFNTGNLPQHLRSSLDVSRHSGDEGDAFNAKNTATKPAVEFNDQFQQLQSALDANKHPGGNLGISNTKNAPAQITNDGLIQRRQPPPVNKRPDFSYIGKPVGSEYKKVDLFGTFPQQPRFTAEAFRALQEQVQCSSVNRDPDLGSASKPQEFRSSTVDSLDPIKQQPRSRPWDREPGFSNPGETVKPESKHGFNNQFPAYGQTCRAPQVPTSGLSPLNKPSISAHNAANDSFANKAHQPFPPCAWYRADEADVVETSPDEAEALKSEFLGKGGNVSAGLDDTYPLFSYESEPGAVPYTGDQGFTSEDEFYVDDMYGDLAAPSHQDPWMEGTLKW